jgi:uncharacterized protein (DUF1778 family)
MGTTTDAKSGRLQIRCDETAKRRIEQAAAYERKTVSEFVVETALERAERVIDENDRQTLSEPDWDLFYAAITKPPKPNKNLRTAFRRYRKKSGDGR